MKSQAVARIKQAIEKEVFPIGSGEDAYSIAEDISAACNELDCLEFDELWTYIQMLLKYKMLIIQDNLDENIIDGTRVGNTYREYVIQL